MRNSKAAILIVEDERVVAVDIQQQLASVGYRTSGIASSAQEALLSASKDRPDLVLMDVRIRGELDGIDTARLLRKKFEVPVVYLTAHADMRTLARAMATQPYGYVVKPFTPAQLHSAVEVALAKHEAERNLRRWERWFSTMLEMTGGLSMLAGALENAPGGVLLESASRNIEFVNRTFCDLFDLHESPVALVGASAADIMRKAQGLFTESAQFVQRSEELVELRAKVVNELVQRADGRVFERDSVPVFVEGHHHGHYWVYRDVSERERTTSQRSEELLRQAMTDELTGLYNRRGFLDIAGARRRVCSAQVLIFADLDGLKDINDKLGHLAGDEALVEFSRRFQEAFRSTDIVARIGGDEFVALATAPLAAVETMVSRLHQRLSDGRLDPRYRLTASVGLTELSETSPSIEAALAAADANMYETKRAHRSGAHVKKA